MVNSRITKNVFLVWGTMSVWECSNLARQCLRVETLSTAARTKPSWCWARRHIWEWSYSTVTAQLQYSYSKVTAQFIPNSDIKRRWCVGFTFRPLYPREKAIEEEGRWAPERAWTLFTSDLTHLAAASRTTTRRVFAHRDRRRCSRMLCGLYRDILSLFPDFYSSDSASTANNTAVFFASSLRSSRLASSFLAPITELQM